MAEQLIHVEVLVQRVVNSAEQDGTQLSKHCDAADRQTVFRRLIDLSDRLPNGVGSWGLPLNVGRLELERRA